MYKYDLHVHTKQTSYCGRVDAAVIPSLYKEKGYSGIAITDHYYAYFFDTMEEKDWESKINRYLTGYRIAKEEGKKIGMDILLGIELTFKENMNDYLIYGITESFLLKYPELFHYGLSDFRELANEHDLLIYQAHPFRNHITRADTTLLDGIEVYNGNGRHDSKNDLALAHAKTNNMRHISCSDFHQYEDLAKGGVLMPKRISSSSDLVEYLKSNQPELIWKI